MSNFFSIIIPTYNRAQLIKDTIKSVLAQTYTNFEVIIVDDGGTDNTEEVINSFNDKRLFYHKKINEERGVARNYGANLAKGAYINFFDSDDIMLPRHLEEANKIISNNNCIAWFAFSHQFVKPNLELIQEYNISNQNKQNLILGNFLSCNSVFIKTEVFKNYYFNSNRKLAALEDWELWLRCSVDLDILLLPIVTNLVVNHDERSVLKANNKALMERFDFFIATVNTNKKLVNFYSKSLNRFYASCYSYIALHIALTKTDKALTLTYTLKSLKYNIFFLFERRFLAIVKHLILP